MRKTLRGVNSFGGWFEEPFSLIRELPLLLSQLALLGLSIVLNLQETRDVKSNGIFPSSHHISADQNNEMMSKSPSAHTSELPKLTEFVS